MAREIENIAEANVITSEAVRLTVIRVVDVSKRAKTNANELVFPDVDRNSPILFNNHNLSD